MFNKCYKKVKIKKLSYIKKIVKKQSSCLKFINIFELNTKFTPTVKNSEL